MRAIGVLDGVSLGYFERTESDFRMFERVFKYWTRSDETVHGYHPLIFDIPKLRVHSVFSEITARSADDDLIRIFFRPGRGREHWVGNVYKARLSARQATLSVSVFKPWFRNGIASRAVTVLLKNLAADGCRQVRVGVGPRNRASLSLFRKLGFKEAGIMTKTRHGWLVAGDRLLVRSLAEP